MNSDETVPPDQVDDIDFIAIWKFAWASKYLILPATLLCAALAALVAFNMTPIFRAETVVIAVSGGGMGAAGSLSSQLGGLASIASLAGVNLNSGGSADREAKAILQSRRLAEEFIEQNNLIEELLPKDKNPPPTLWLAVKAFREGVLDIREDKRSGLMTLGIDWKDPAIAAQWVNNFVALANDRIRARAIDEANRNIKFLDEQIEKTRVLEVQRAIYSLIENETKTLMLANARSEYAFTVIDPAVTPERKIRPKRSLYILFGAFVGSGIGMLAAYLRRGRTRSKHAESGLV